MSVVVCSGSESLPSFFFGFFNAAFVASMAYPGGSDPISGDCFGPSEVGSVFVAYRWFCRLGVAFLNVVFVASMAYPGSDPTLGDCFGPAEVGSVFVVSRLSVSWMLLSLWVLSSSLVQ